MWIVFVWNVTKISTKSNNCFVHWTTLVWWIFNSTYTSRDIKIGFFFVCFVHIKSDVRPFWILPIFITQNIYLLLEVLISIYIFLFVKFVQDCKFDRNLVENNRWIKLNCKRWHALRKCENLKMYVTDTVL